MAQPAPKLPPQLDDFIDEQVRSGAYADRNAVITDALDLLRERMAGDAIDDETKLARLNAKLQKGIDQLDRGEGIVVDDIEAFFDEITAEITAEIDAESSERAA